MLVVIINKLLKLGKFTSQFILMAQVVSGLKIPNSFAQTANVPARIKTDLRISQPHYQHLYHLHQLHSFMSNNPLIFVDKHTEIIQYACNTFHLNHCTHFPLNSFNPDFLIQWLTI